MNLLTSVNQKAIDEYCRLEYTKNGNDFDLYYDYDKLGKTVFINDELSVDDLVKMNIDIFNHIC